MSVTPDGVSVPLRTVTFTMQQSAKGHMYFDIKMSQWPAATEADIKEMLTTYDRVHAELLRRTSPSAG